MMAAILANDRTKLEFLRTTQKAKIQMIERIRNHDIQLGATVNLHCGTDVECAFAFAADDPKAGHGNCATMTKVARKIFIVKQVAIKGRAIAREAHHATSTSLVKGTYPVLDNSNISL
jgi:hypothetical protein